MLLITRISDPVDSLPEPVEGSFRVLRFARLRDRGAVTVEKAMLVVVVILFGWVGIRFVGDPLRDPVFSVIFGILMWIYELIATVFGGVR